MVIHIDLLLYTFTTCSYLYFWKYYYKSSKLGLSSSKCIVSHSIVSQSAWPPVSSSILSSVLSSGLCHCLCSMVFLLASLALVFPSLTQDQLAKSSWICLGLDFLHMFVPYLLVQLLLGFFLQSILDCNCLVRVGLEVCHVCC